MTTRQLNVIAKAVIRRGERTPPGTVHWLSPVEHRAMLAYPLARWNDLWPRMDCLARHAVRQ